MQLTGVALLVVMAVTVTAYPRPEPKQAHLFKTSNPERERSRHIEGANIAPLIARGEKGICTTLELPTEASYKTGYEAFCYKYVPTDATIVMGPGAAPLVATYMLKTHIGTEIPWIFKIRSTAWGFKPYYLKQTICKSGFRDMLESERAKVGTNYCVVDGSGGNGDSKKFSGQGYVLVTGSEMAWRAGDVNEISTFETRRRKGKFDPNNPDGKKG